MLKTYDHIVAGSGVSGMTAALLLAKNGRKVLLLEKAPAMGGSLLRFRRQEVPCDSGLHFTGGFGKQGIFTKMLEHLGIRDAINPIFYSSQRILLEKTGTLYDLPCGIDALRKRLGGYFPQEQAAIDAYFAKLTEIYETSAEIVFNEGQRYNPLCPEDAISLQAALDDLTKNDDLKALLSIFCMCYGTKPEEVSYATHCRVCYSLFESLARVENGGDALIRAFRARFKELGVDVLCNTHIVRCGEIIQKNVRSFHLSNGEEVAFESAVLTMHPQEIIKIIPRENLRPALINRVKSFEESVGFFTIFATLDLPQTQTDPIITSLLPSVDMNAILTPAQERESALIITRSREKVKGREIQTLTVFEPCSPEEVAAWRETTTGSRPADYHAYKEQRTARMVARILEAHPEYAGHLNVIDSASTLTYRDWLHSLAGGAYGIKQKVGQVNLLGKLPLTNLYAAGQSAILPGVVGAMMSSFVACRSLLGISSYGPALNK